MRFRHFLGNFPVFFFQHINIKVNVLNCEGIRSPRLRGPKVQKFPSHLRTSSENSRDLIVHTSQTPKVLSV